MSQSNYYVSSPASSNAAIGIMAGAAAPAGAAAIYGSGSGGGGGGGYGNGGAGSGDASTSSSVRGSMLPRTNMGKFVHLPGDNHYAGGSQLRSMEKSAGWYKAPSEVQIVDSRPIVRDFREDAPAPSRAQSAQSKRRESANEEKAESSQKIQVSRNLKSGVDETASTADKNAVKTADKIDSKLRLLMKSTKQTAKHQKTKIKIMLSTAPGSDLLDKLNKAGLNVSKRQGTTVFGFIDLSKLEDLAKIAEILSIQLD